MRAVKWSVPRVRADDMVNDLLARAPEAIQAARDRN